MCAVALAKKLLGLVHRSRASPIWTRGGDRPNIHRRLDSAAALAIASCTRQDGAQHLGRIQSTVAARLTRAHACRLQDSRLCMWYTLTRHETASDPAFDGQQQRFRRRYASDYRELFIESALRNTIEPSSTSRQRWTVPMVADCRSIGVLLDLPLDDVGTVYNTCDRLYPPALTSTRISPSALHISYGGPRTHIGAAWRGQRCRQ